MSKYWNERVQRLEPYVPGEQPKDKKYVKLNTNENPYPPSPKVIRAIKEAADDRLRLYPDPEAEQLRAALADHYHLSPAHVFIGNGSDEVLAFSFMSFFSPEKPVMFADITYSFYKVYADLCALRPEIIPLDEAFRIPVQDFCRPGGGVVIPNPNAPTGRGITTESIRKILEADPDRVVIIDEAYVNFGGTSVVPLVKEYPNLLVVQTLSKFCALAGIRVGFAFGSPELIDGLNRLKNSINSYTIDRLALTGARAAVEDLSYSRHMAERVITTREQAERSLRELGFQIIPSESNFIFITHPDYEAEQLFNQLKQKGILVRYFHQPRISNYLRVTIGTDNEMNQLIAAMKKLLNH
ncbi:histidinol-phosphate transaminase [Sporolactobacillus sp. THM19-2]|uniref:histidinol-phosphate transaminase n=1 Tax=Sporolactobacillus sp. THM19-2 TaxID=2511171 RepID=UPI00101F5364|nr:histidinol-phosphate transaminase [Sporolactobacillus sp. THM19-2]RYL92172.1 histidinol-phosphate transaminase [Sporolactobacillus sp. THM19-2]